jgi:acyl dehydratase
MTAITRWADLAVGQEACLEHRFTTEDVAQFAALCGDNQPLHLNAEFAGRTFFKQPIVHGMLTASLFSTLIGTRLPGPGSIYIGQDLKFLRPVYMNETVRACLRITALDLEKERIHLAGDIINAAGKAVLSGTSEVTLLRNLD